MFRRNLVRDSGELAAPFLFSELLHIWCGTCQGVAVHGEYHKETVGSRKNLARFLKDLAPCGHSQCLISDSRRLEVHVSRNLTSAGAREGGGGTGTSAFGRPNCPGHCPVKAGRQGVSDIHKSPDSMGSLLIVGRWLHISTRGVCSDVWNLRRITRTFTPQAVCADPTQRTKGLQPVQADSSVRCLSLITSPFHF